MPDPTRIRPLVLADLDAVLELAAALPTAPRWPAQAWTAVLDPDAAPRRIALAAESEGRLTAIAVASLLAPEAELESICVAPDSQRRGLGGLLLTALVAELREQGVGRLLLEVRASNLPALALYRSLGFRQTGRRPRYYADPEEDALLLELVLNTE
jgi:ribosomal-protein-alanine N-acetyltransferase